MIDPEGGRDSQSSQVFRGESPSPEQMREKSSKVLTFGNIPNSLHTDDLLGHIQIEREVPYPDGLSPAHQDKLLSDEAMRDEVLQQR